MKKIGGIYIFLSYFVGLVYLLAYYFLMTEFFKADPFTGIYLVISIYIVICYILFPWSWNHLYDLVENTPLSVLTFSKLFMGLGFFFPFILLFHDKEYEKDKEEKDFYEEI